MRLVDRIARLEKRDGVDPRMTAGEMEVAAAHLERVIALGDLPPGVTADQSRASWLGLVSAPGPGWLQRTYANMGPQDIFL